MKGTLAGLFGFAVVVVMLATSYLILGTWQARVTVPAGVFASERDAVLADARAKGAAPEWSLYPGDTVQVLWDRHRKDNWACYVRSPDGRRGWVLCTSLQRIARDKGDT
jgi:hypothetical protein